MKKFLTSIPNLILSVVLCFVLSSCSSTGVKTNESSPWKTIQFEDQANALDVDFIDDNHGFLVGSNRLIMESTDGGETWEKRSLDISAEENLTFSEPLRLQMVGPLHRSHTLACTLRSGPSEPRL